MKLLSNVSEKFITTSNLFLLFFIIFIVFLIPFFPLEIHQLLYTIFFVIVFLLSSLTLVKSGGKIFIIAVIVIALQILSDLLNLSLLSKASMMANILFFDLVVVLFIRQITLAKTVAPRVILESVTGYIMLGMSFSILIALICLIDPNSFSFKHLTEPFDPSISYMSDYIYYGFVTLSTLGYGDLVPLSPAAKSLSIFTAITGQLYIAIIIAAIISKYLSQKKSGE